MDRKQYESERCERRKLERLEKRALLPRECRECHAVFYSRSHPLVKYCSDSCRLESRRKQMIQAASEPNAKEKQRIAAREYYWKHRNDPGFLEIRSQKQTDRFRKKQSHKNQTRIYQCRWCGKDFNPPMGRVRYCSQECHKSNTRSLVNARNKLPHIKAKRNAALRAKKRRDPVFRLQQIVTWTIKRALNKNQGERRSGVLKALPYSIPQLKAHIESQFDNTNGFTWENYGSLWHIDHIIPQAFFRFTDLDSKLFRDCWALTNLRPLEKIANIKKGAKLI